MKIKTLRYSKSIMSVILSICMLVSCVTVGMVHTGAAQIENDSVGWTQSQCYIHIKIGSAEWTNYSMSNNKITFSVPSDNTTCKYLLVAEDTWYRKNGSDAVPSSSSTNSNSYYAKTEGDDFSITLNAGVYTVEYVARHDNDATLQYRLYKSADYEYGYQLGYRVSGADASTNQYSDFSGGSTSVSLNDGVTYQFWIKRSDDKYYKDQGNGTMTRDNCTGWTFKNDNSLSDTKITTDGTGIYTFSYTKSGNDLSVSVTYPTLYNVNFTPAPTGGTVKVNSSSTSPVKVAKNNDFTIKATPSAGYTVDYVKVGTTALTATSGNDTNGYNYTSNVGTTNKTVTAAFKKKDLTLTKDSETNGTFVLSTASANPATKAQVGDTVTVTCTPNQYYKVGTVTFNGTNATKQSDNVWTFTMPGANTTVKVTFIEQTHNVTVASSNTNRGTVSPASITGKPLTAYNLSGITVTPKTGYKFNGWTATSNITLSGTSQTNSQSGTLKATGTGTLTANFAEILHNVTVKRKLIKADNSEEVISTAVQTVTNVGIATTGTVSAVDNLTYDSGNYTFDSFVLPTGVTGTPDGSNAFTINATVGNAVIYIVYKETMHTLTLVNEGNNGSIKNNAGNTINSVQVGNVTGVSLTATAKEGYFFNGWEKTSGSSNVTILDDTFNPGNLTDRGTATFKLKGDATVTAKYQGITHKIFLKRRYYSLNDDSLTLLSTDSYAYKTYITVNNDTATEITAPTVKNCTFRRFSINSGSGLQYSGKGADVLVFDESSTVSVFTKENATSTDEYTIYVDYVISGNVSVYVDMNENVGNPVLNFKYHESNGTPVASGGTETERNLPFEMDLVNGSDSVYQYTINTSSLNKDYKLSFDADNPLNISSISVEDKSFNNSSLGYDITTEALMTGEIWFKADSTNMRNFENISYGSVTNSFVGVVSDGTELQDCQILDSAIQSIRGTGSVTNDDDVYHTNYAGLYTVTSNNNGTVTQTLVKDFHYVLKAVAKNEVTVNNNGTLTTYYFDKWIKCATENVTRTTNNYIRFHNTSVISDNGIELDFTKAFVYKSSLVAQGDGAYEPDPSVEQGNYSYIALYKQASTDTVRVEVTYKFKDYDTSDGNEIMHYTPNELDGLSDDALTNKLNEKTTADTSYTKTIVIKLNSGQTFQGIVSTVDTIASQNVPFVESNYFNYSYKTGSANITKQDSTEKKIVVTAELSHTPREYVIIYGNATYTGYYQQTKELTGGSANTIWKMNGGVYSNPVAVGKGATYTARFVPTGIAQSGTKDVQVITTTTETTNVLGTTVITNVNTLKKDENDTSVLHHNFTIVDYCEKGTLIGGGVIYATANKGGDYRQAAAEQYLTDNTKRVSYINSILNGDYDTEYNAQTIKNIGFRYKKYNPKESVFHFSQSLSGYITVFEGTNVNSSNYQNQTLRLFSFMVYNTGTEQTPVYTIVTSDGYAEVDRYQAN